MYRLYGVTFLVGVEEARGDGAALSGGTGEVLVGCRAGGSAGVAVLPVCRSMVATSRPEVKESPAPLVLILVPAGRVAAGMWAAQFAQD